jgi:hypothetical protein
MKRKIRHDDVTLQRLERARAAIAFAMTLDGAVYAPIFERLESEIAERRAADDVMARAKACLVDYAAATMPPEGRRAIS